MFSKYGMITDGENQFINRIEKMHRIDYEAKVIEYYFHAKSLIYDFNEFEVNKNLNIKMYICSGNEVAVSYDGLFEEVYNTMYLFESHGDIKRMINMMIPNYIHNTELIKRKQLMESIMNKIDTEVSLNPKETKKLHKI